RLQPAQRRGIERDVATVAAGDVQRDGEPEAAAAFILVARAVEPAERPEHLRTHFLRNPRPVVLHGDRQLAVLASSADDHLAAVTAGITDQIGYAALEGIGPDQCGDAFGCDKLRAGMTVPGFAGDLVQQRTNVGFDALLPLVTAHEVDVVLQHVLHFV